MQVDVFCDESMPDLLGKNCQEPKFMVIGALKIPRSLRQEINGKIKDLRNEYSCYGEFKWGRISDKKLEFYKSVVDLFFESRMKYRCIAVDASRVDLKRYHDNNSELAFYKFYYEVFQGQLPLNNSYRIYCDERTTHNNHRWDELKKVLKNASACRIDDIYPIQSKLNAMVQMSDLLTGCVQARFNSVNQNLCLSEAKLAVLKHLEDKLGHSIKRTEKSEQKFNVFEIYLKRVH